MSLQVRGVTIQLNFAFSYNARLSVDCDLKLFRMYLHCGMQ
jgi:hypothetical protein